MFQQRTRDQGQGTDVNAPAPSVQNSAMALALVPWSCPFLHFAMVRHSFRAFSPPAASPGEGFSPSYCGS